MAKSKLLKTRLNKWRKLESRAAPPSPFPSPSSGDGCCQWAFSAHSEDHFIPRDVPRGHLAVYVGENYRRFVIKIALLDHPLFRALLDRARDEFDFTTISKLCIPCDEKVFVDLVRCVASLQHDKRVFLCF